MSEIVLLDTSVLLNVLNVPGFNESREAVIAELERLIEGAAHLFIPMAAVFETGNHIAQLSDGRVRRYCARQFVSAIQAAIDDRAPWKPMRMPDVALVRSWLNDFPEAAMRGHGMGDLSIRKEWQVQCEQFSMSRVRVWSLDQDLAGLDRTPNQYPAR